MSTQTIDRQHAAHFKAAWAGSTGRLAATIILQAAYPGRTITEADLDAGPNGRTQLQLSYLKVVFKRMMVEAGLGDPFTSRLGSDVWRFEFNSRLTRAMGRTIWGYGDQRIEISTNHAKYAPYETLRDTMLHEIAHALAGREHNHNAYWKMIARALGDSGARCYSDDSYLPETARGKWKAVCPNGHEHYKARRPTKTTSCGKCCRTYNPSYRLIFEERA